LVCPLGLKEGRSISFDRFVELSLYHPEFGYYTKKRVLNRPGEDFFTAPELSPLFSRVVASFLKERIEELKLPRAVVEVGGGKGFLAKDLIEFLEPESYYFVERREPPQWLKGKVKWVRGVEELPENLEGVIVANELFDAFPFKRVFKKGGELWEVVVACRGGRLTEEFRPFRGELPCELSEGAEYPLFIGWEDFLKTLAGKLKRGLFLTFDYGGSCREVASKKSFRAYREGRIVEDYLEKVGQTDLTADVDFTRLRKLFGEVGFKEVLYEPQSTFLLKNGIERFASPSELPQVLTLLVDMGRRFKALAGQVG